MARRRPRRNPDWVRPAVIGLALLICYAAVIIATWTWISSTCD